MEHENITLTYEQFFNTSVHIGAHYILRFVPLRHDGWYDQPIGIKIEYIGEPQKEKMVTLTNWYYMDDSSKTIIPTPKVNRIVALMKELIVVFIAHGIIQYHLCSASLHIPNIKPIPLNIPSPNS